MKKCPFCAEEIQDGAIVCKFCKSSLVDNKDKPSSLSSEQKKWLIATLVVSTIFFIIIITNITSRNSTSSESQINSSSSLSNDLQIGDEGYLRLPGILDPTQVICLGTTKDDANAITKATMANDYMGLLEIPGAFCVGNGSQIKFIERSFPLNKVRIVKGVNEVDSDKIGLSGWLPYEWVVKD